MLSAQTAVLLSAREVVPGSEARLLVPVSGLSQLPDSAGYTARNGRATARLTVRRDTVIVSATCDSLERLVDYYVAMNKELNLSKHDDFAQEETKPPDRRWLKFFTYMIVFFAGLTVGIVITMIKTKK